MTEIKEKITAVQNAEEQAKITKQLEDQIENQTQAILELENKLYKSEQARVNLAKVLKKTEAERDSWKNQAHAANRVYQNREEVKKEADFEAELAKLQANKGININA